MTTRIKSPSPTQSKYPNSASAGPNVIVSVSGLERERKPVTDGHVGSERGARKNCSEPEKNRRNEMKVRELGTEIFSDRAHAYVMICARSIVQPTRGLMSTRKNGLYSLSLSAVGSH